MTFYKLTRYAHLQRSMNMDTSAGRTVRSSAAAARTSRYLIERGNDAAVSQRPQRIINPVVHEDYRLVSDRPRRTTIHRRGYNEDDDELIDEPPVSRQPSRRATRHAVTAAVGDDGAVAVEPDEPQQAFAVPTAKRRRTTRRHDEETDEHAQSSSGDERPVIKKYVVQAFARCFLRASLPALRQVNGTRQLRHSKPITSYVDLGSSDNEDDGAHSTSRKRTAAQPAAPDVSQFGRLRKRRMILDD